MPLPPDTSLRSVDVSGIGRVWLREGTSDQAVLDQILFSEEFNISTAPQFIWVLEAYEKQLAAGETPLVIDCGANIGLSALYFAKHLPRARIVGIEPAADNVEIARRNTAHNPMIEIVEAAVNDTATPLRIANPDAEKFAYRTEEAGSGGIVVPGVTIPDLMQRHGARSSLIVKVDIEGAELALFRSNTAWLDTTRLLIAETHDWLFPGQGTSRTLFKALEGRSFEVNQRGEYISFFFC